jgi:hypothetical protein
MVKTCTKCGLSLPIDSFSSYKYKGDTRLRARCKNCRTDDQKERYSKNPDVHRGYLYKQKYGITLEQYDQMVVEQEGVCLICDTDTPMGHHKRFVVDHNHTSGEVRGLLCSKCNSGLGCFSDNPNTLLKAAQYLLSKGHYGTD